MSSLSDSASSDEDAKPQTAGSPDSDSDSDASPKPTKQNAASSDSSGSDSDSEKPTPVQTKKKVLSKRKRKASGSSDDDQVDDTLFADREDKARWKGLSELEKEREIFERMEARESARAREEIAQQLAKKAKKNSEKGSKNEKRRRMGSGGSGPSSPKAGSDSDSDMNAEFHNPSDINRKHKEKNAMDALKSKRKEIEKKNAKKSALSIDDVFGANSGSSSSSSSSESSRSSSSSRDSSPERTAEQEKVVKKELDSLTDLRKARLSRHKLSLMIHAPFFNSTVIGCYVRLGQGMMSGSESKYKIWKIISVEESNKVYDLEGKKTNKSIKCQFGRTERLFRMQFVSNSEFEQVEYEEWLHATKNNGLPVPTVDVIEKKRLDIEKAVHHKFSDIEIDQMIKEKSKFQKVPRNFAMTKASLSKRKELAQQTGDIREAERIQKEIDEIERHADELDKQRTKAISAIAFINHRNRTQIKDQVLSGQLKIEENSQDDPFTRKKGGMRVVSGSKSKLDGTLSASSSSTNLVEVGKDSSASQAKPTPAPPVLVNQKKKSADLTSLHNFDLDIDFDKLPEVGTMDVGSSKRPSISSSKGMSLADYRNRRTGGSDAGSGPSTSSSSMA